MNSDVKAPLEAALRESVPFFDRHVLWSYGTGNTGVGEGELCGPHSAEENPFEPDEILVAEQFGCDVLIVNRSTRKMRVLYGDRGVPGGGDHLGNTPAAHFMPAGPYRGHVLLAEYDHEHRLMILHRDSGKVLWSCADLEAPLDAIYWDEEHIMASDCKRGIYKIRLEDQAQVWHYDSKPHGHPFYLHKLRNRVDGRNFHDSYGGDLLAGFWGPYRVVQEIDTATGEVAWSYGDRGEQGGVLKKNEGDLYDRLSTPVRALRYGIQEHGAGYTVIVDERARILCVNVAKELIWELGGSSGDLYGSTPYCILPTYIQVTRRGTFLVTDWGRSMIYEMNPFCIPQRTEKDGYLFKVFETSDGFADSSIMESRGYKDKNLQIYNKHDASSALWRVLGSHNTEDWQEINTPAPLGPGEGTHLLIEGPWNFIKAQCRSAACATPAKVSAYLTMRR